MHPAAIKHTGEVVHSFEMQLVRGRLRYLRRLILRYRFLWAVLIAFDYFAFLLFSSLTISAENGHFSLVSHCFYCRLLRLLLSYRER